MPAKRVRVTDEEYEMIREIRDQRIAGARSRGGSLRGSDLREKLDDGLPRPTNALKGRPKQNDHELTDEDRRRGGIASAEKRRQKEGAIKGIAAIHEEMERRGVGFFADADPEYAPGMEEGELRADDICEVTSNRTGIISDVHVPFHHLERDKATGELYGHYLTALDFLKEQKIQTLIINGDWIDNYQLSTHEKLEKKRSHKDELTVASKMLGHLREFFGNGVRIIYREGNHEERWQRYLGRVREQASNKHLLDTMRYITDLPDDEDPQLPLLLKLRDYGIEWVGDRSKLTIGKLWVDHGHEWFGSGGVNPARAYRLKAQDNILVGHVHRTTFDLFKRPLDGSLFAGWSMGCLTDLNPRYAPRNSWNHGVVTVDLDGSGEFSVNNRIIINGRVR